MHRLGREGLPATLNCMQNNMQGMHIFLIHQIVKELATKKHKLLTEP